MRKNTWKQALLWLVLLAAGTVYKVSFAASPPQVVQHYAEKVQANEDWKLAYATGKNAQVVFMSVSPKTNTNNEIGMETHAFDQVILIIEGKGKAILNGKTFAIETGDMIFIPQGTAHNVINSDSNKALKILSFYSANDIPVGASYKKKTDEPQG